MLTGAQIRMARAYLKWTAKELAQKAGVGYSTIQRMELEDGVPAASAKNVQAVQSALEAAGVTFTSDIETVGVSISLS